MNERERLQRARAPAPALSPSRRTRRAHSVRALAFMRGASGAGILPGGVVHPEIASLISHRAGRGNRLDAAMATWSQDTLGLDAGRVSVHHDATAAQLTGAVAARAFAVRNDVFFGQHEYQPATASGRRLIAHELTHVAQQQEATTTGPLRVTEAGDAHEREADHLSSDVT
jgi:Domain of unknown function (DUF4157)